MKILKYIFLSFVILSATFALFHFYEQKRDLDWLGCDYNTHGNFTNLNLGDVFVPYLGGRGAGGVDSTSCGPTRKLLENDAWVSNNNNIAEVVSNKEVRAKRYGYFRLQAKNSKATISGFVLPKKGSCKIEIMNTANLATKVNEPINIEFKVIDFNSQENIELPLDLFYSHQSRILGANHYYPKKGEPVYHGAERIIENLKISQNGNYNFIAAPKQIGEIEFAISIKDDRCINEFTKLRVS